MGRTYAEITPELAEFIERQRLFFTASAPSGSEGHVNCSPKGLDSLAILGPRRVAYLDLVGSGARSTRAGAGLGASPTCGRTAASC